MKESDFHVLIGGRKRWESRFSDRPEAVEIRDEIIKFKKSTGQTNQEIAERIGVSGSTLSRSAGGRAGNKIGRDGKSTTVKILERLKALNIE